MDDSIVLDGPDYQKYQMFIDVLNWIVILCQLDVAYSASSLARFVNQNEFKDSIIVENGNEGILGIALSLKMKDQCLDAEKLNDVKVPDMLFDEMVITAYI
eukprot:737337-Ditylum_brightwellii.AAC.1